MQRREFLAGLGAAAADSVYPMRLQVGGAR